MLALILFKKYILLKVKIIDYLFLDKNTVLLQNMTLF